MDEKGCVTLPLGMYCTYCMHCIYVRAYSVLRQK